MTNRKRVATGPAVTQRKGGNVRARRLWVVIFLMATLAGLTAAQIPQTDYQPTTRTELIRDVQRSNAIFLGVSTTAVAQKSALDGTYTLDEADSDNIAEAIEDAVRKSNFLTRYIARGRLKKLNPTYRKLLIASSLTEISVSVDDHPPLRAPAKGTTVAWVGPDGAKVNVSMQLVGGRLVQTFNSADGHRVNDYTLSRDGRVLTMRVTETSPRLSQAVTYKQVYRRVS